MCIVYKCTESYINIIIIYVKLRKRSWIWEGVRINWSKKKKGSDAEAGLMYEIPQNTKITKWSNDTLQYKIVKVSRVSSKSFLCCFAPDWKPNWWNVTCNFFMFFPTQIFLPTCYPGVALTCQFWWVHLF